MTTATPALPVTNTAEPPFQNQPRQRPRWLIHVFIAAALLITITPFLWMLLYSFSPEARIRGGTLDLWPPAVTTENYTQLFTRLNFPRFFINSTIVAVVVTVGNLLFASMVGYALAKIPFRGKNLIFGLVLGMLMIPAIVTFVPLFVFTSKLGLINTYPGLIAPYLVTPIGVFLMRQFIEGIPDEILQAARVDGANELRIFLQIVLPLAGPALATLSILSFLSSWNNFLWPLVVAQTDNYYTLPVALSLYSIGTSGTNYGLLMAGAVVVILPILVLFIFLQRYFTQGVATTGIK